MFHTDGTDGKRFRSEATSISIMNGVMQHIDHAIGAFANNQSTLQLDMDLAAGLSKKRRKQLLDTAFELRMLQNLARISELRSMPFAAGSNSIDLSKSDNDVDDDEEEESENFAVSSDKKVVHSEDENDESA
jgi:hypothetical protein